MKPSGTEAGGRATQALKLVPSPAQAPPSPPGAPSRRVTGRRFIYQVPVLPPRLGQANPTHQFLRPENRDSPDSRKLHNPGPTAAAAAEGEGKARGEEIFFSLSYFLSTRRGPSPGPGLSWPPQDVGPPRSLLAFTKACRPRPADRAASLSPAGLLYDLQTAASPGRNTDLRRPSPVPAGLIKTPRLCRVFADLPVPAGLLKTPRLRRGFADLQGFRRPSHGLSRLPCWASFH